MTLSLQTRRNAVAAAIALALTACGGGGGGSSEPPQDPRVEITATNATAVSAQALDAGAAAFFGNAVDITGVQIDAPSATGGTWFTGLGAALRKLREPRAQPLLTGVTVTESGECTGGGTYALRIELAVRDEIAAGDTASLTFTDCLESGVLLDGNIALTFVSVNPQFTVYTADAVANGLTARGPAGAIGQRANGTLRIAVDESSATTSTLRVTSEVFSFERLVGSTVRATRTLIDYDYRVVTALATGRTSETFSYVATGTFPRLGTISFSAATTAPVVTAGGALRPSSGAATVTGASGSSVDITVLSTGVRLEIDSNGNGTVDTTVTRTWPEIDNAL